MKKATNLIPFVFALGYILFLIFSNLDKLNGLKIFGLSLGVLIVVYSIFIIVTEQYIDFKDGMKIKRIKR